MSLTALRAQQIAQEVARIVASVGVEIRVPESLSEDFAVYFYRDGVELPIAPFPGLLIFLGQRGADPFCPGLRVRSVAFREGEGLTLDCESWTYRPSEDRFIGNDDREISFRMILGLAEVGQMKAYRAEKLLRHCRARERKWQAQQQPKTGRKRGGKRG